MIDDTQNDTKQDWYQMLDAIEEKLDNASDDGGGATNDMNYQMAQQRDKIKAGYHESIEENADAVDEEFEHRMKAIKEKARASGRALE